MDDPGPSLFIQIFLPLTLILINAYFAMSEIAIISLNDNKIARMAEEGNKKAKQIVALTKNSNNFLSTIQIGITLAGFLTSAAASQSFAVRLTEILAQTAIVKVMPYTLINGFSIFIVTFITSYFTLVLGELVPKRIAMQLPEKVSFIVVGPLLVILKIAKPFIKVLSLSTNAIIRILGIDPNFNQETVTEEEIRMMVDVGEERGVIEETQKDMINNIFEFDDIDAGDIMTHRTDMVAVDVEDSIEEAVKIAVEDGYSRIPVYEEDLDNIIGIIYVKDFLPFVGKSLPDKNLREVMRKAYYVPETKRCGELFTEMTERHIQMAIVVDEYGGTAGIITLEDLIEAIVGNIQDEYDDEDEEIAQINETTFTIDGITDLDEVDELVGADLPNGDYDTLGGFIIDLLGYLPEDGDMSEALYENIRFTVLNVEDRRIGKVRVEILPQEEEPEKDEKKKGKNGKEEKDD